MGLLVGPARRTSWTDQLDGPAGRTSWTDQSFLFEALASSHIQRFSFQFVHCRSLRVQRRLCFLSRNPWLVVLWIWYFSTSVFLLFAVLLRSIQFWSNFDLLIYLWSFWYSLYNNWSHQNKAKSFFIQLFIQSELDTASALACLFIYIFISIRNKTQLVSDQLRKIWFCLIFCLNLVWRFIFYVFLFHQSSSSIESRLPSK